MRLARVVVVMGLIAAPAAPAMSAGPPAKELFGAAGAPAPLEAMPYGSYAKGCLAGGRSLTWNGTNHQVMRLSRNRYWGHPALIDYLNRLGPAAGEDGWTGLMVGDMAQPRGGPMLTGHASHQIGLDADIWLQPMPGHIMTNEERENVSAISMLTDGLKEINPDTWSEGHARLIRRAASFPEVARIFVNPVIKRELCEWAGNDRGWLRVIRPWYGHHYHFHVRLKCPSGASGCVNQAAPAPGDGCGADLAKWFVPPPPRPDPPPPPPPPKPELTMADLPGACQAVLDAE